MRKILSAASRSCTASTARSPTASSWSSSAPVGLRQVDPAAHDRRPRDGHRRRDRISAGGWSTGWSRPSATSPWCSRTTRSIPHMSVYDNMAYGLKIRRLSRPRSTSGCASAAEILELGDEMLKRKPRQLSGGQRQRVAMGRAIVREPARCSCSTSRSPTWTPSCGPRCAWRSRSPAGRARRHIRLRHPRPGRGHDARPPASGDEPGQRGAARHAARALRPPGHGLRRRLPGLAGNKLPAGDFGGAGQGGPSGRRRALGAQGPARRRGAAPSPWACARSTSASTRTAAPWR